MTAEIGVLNTIGVALAADSAVTIGTSKIFNTADKLFSLSKHHPVGIMIYGSAEYMGVPWETVIKIYRKKLGDRQFDKLNDYSEDFINFLTADERFYDQHYESNLVKRKFLTFLDSMLDDINMIIPEVFKIEPPEHAISNIIFAEALFYADFFNRHYAMVEGFKETYAETFYDQFHDVIQELLNSRINVNLDDETINFFVHIAAKLIMNDIYTNETGLVVAGFGEEEIFPSLKSFSIEGIYNGVLKYKKEQDVTINTSNRATIVPFAQQEMVHSFLTGIDPELKNQVIGLVEKIASIYPEVVNDNITQLDSEQNDNLRAFGQSVLKQFVDQLDQTIAHSFSSPIMDTVSSFPKEELAAMAEALVNLTSIKRKMSYESETVGGPIDVAVISKGDGFIWIKRKHYFQPELNHTYFSNYMKR